MYQMLKNLLFCFSPETAHAIAEMGLRASSHCPLTTKFLQNNFTLNDPKLSQNILGIHFANPLGVAGGFDKNATMVRPLSHLGFGFIEVGTFTPRPQPGNKKPRSFRLISEKSLQNAMGFNNDGAAKIEPRLQKIFPYSTPIFANIGKNKTTPNSHAISDYLYLAHRFDGLCDAFVINISSPNTPNLRDLQNEAFINELFLALKEATSRPLILKIAPDMDIKAAINLCTAALGAGADAIIANNTSTDYSLTPNARDFGGLSGELISKKSAQMMAALGAEFHGRTTLIASGGIMSVMDAYERIKMGASLVQLFTGFIFNGPSICKNINTQLLNMLANDGFENIADAVGSGIKK